MIISFYTKDKPGLERSPDPNAGASHGTAYFHQTILFLTQKKIPFSSTRARIQLMRYPGTHTETSVFHEPQLGQQNSRNQNAQIKTKLHTLDTNKYIKCQISPKIH